MEQCARLALKRVGVREGLAVAVGVDDEALSEALLAALLHAGATLATAGDLAAACVVEADATTLALGPTARAAIDASDPGARVAAIFAGGSGGVSVEQLAEQWRTRLDLARARGERVDEAAVVSGDRRPALRTAERKRLRGLSHTLEATVLVGRAGVSAEVVAAVASALARHGLVKVKLTPQCDVDKGEVAQQLRWATGAHLVQRVGRTALLYRPDVPMDPPVKRAGRRR